MPLFRNSLELCRGLKYSARMQVTAPMEPDCGQHEVVALWFPQDIVDLISTHGWVLVPVAIR